MNTLFIQKDAKRFKLKVGVLLFLIQEGHVLLLRRYNTGIDDGKYVVPMGGLNEGETVSQAIRREAEEEAGITLNQFEVCHTMHRLHRMPDGYTFPQVDFYFRSSDWNGTIKNCEPHKCDELQFYPLKALPEKTVPFIAHALQCSQNGITFSEFGW